MSPRRHSIGLVVSLLVSVAAVACGGVTQVEPSGSAGATGRAGGSGDAGGSGNAGTPGFAGTPNSAGSAGAPSSAGSGGLGGSSCAHTCGFSCCGVECINTGNDIDNCGSCGTKCPGPAPYCDHGKCAPAPCIRGACAAGSTCCEAECCPAGELCCEVNAGASRIACTKPTDKGTCPLGCAQCVCTAPSTPIATPSGERAISELKVGDLVYTLHRGKLVSAPLLLTNRVLVTGFHQMVEVRLSSGTRLSISPSHPTADGRTFDDLEAGDRLDGVALKSVRRVPYAEPYTYDILPDSDSGAYFAGGVLIGTTLAAPDVTNSSVDSTQGWRSSASSGD